LKPEGYACRLDNFVAGALQSKAPMRRPLKTLSPGFPGCCPFIVPYARCPQQSNIRIGLAN
jgi:hypothetical protein